MLVAKNMEGCCLFQTTIPDNFRDFVFGKKPNFRKNRTVPTQMKPMNIIRLCIALLAWSGCHSIPSTPVVPSFSFYHWKANFSPTTLELDNIQKLGVSRLYVRYFDVDKETSSAPVTPLSLLTFQVLPPETIELVPVIFITNRALIDFPENQIINLAEKIWSLILEIHPVDTLPQEIQLDCDWSGRSREAFFQLIKQMKSFGCRVSSTIRLHQIQTADVPPADAGTLMFYNMGEVRDSATKNSILSIEEARPYLPALRSYPLKLDLALPIFSWGVLFRDGKMIKLIHQLEAPELLKDSLTRTNDRINFFVTRNSLLRGHFLYAGDHIRLEATQNEVLLQSARELGRYFGGSEPTITFYHLDSLNLERHTYEILHRVGSEVYFPGQ